MTQNDAQMGRKKIEQRSVQHSAKVKTNYQNDGNKESQVSRTRNATLHDYYKYYGR